MLFEIRPVIPNEADKLLPLMEQLGYPQTLEALTSRINLFLEQDGYGIAVAKEVKTKNVLISPFVHLSNNIADPKKAKFFFDKIYKKVDGSEYNINTAQFGYHKEVLLDIKGHPGSIRYREF